MNAFTADAFIDTLDLSRADKDILKATVGKAMEQEREAWRAAIQEIDQHIGRARQTLRDEFAKAALTGYLAEFTGTECSSPSASTAASMAYEYADAMLLARESK